MDYKRLKASDVDLMKQLLKVFGEAFNDVTYQDAVPSKEYLKAFLSEQVVLVAMIQNEVIGGLVAYELDKFEQERKEFYIYDLAVVKKHRRKGVATQLIRELQKIAKERKAYVIFVQADKADHPAVKFYESLGKKEEVYHFDIPIKN